VISDLGTDTLSSGFRLEVVQKVQLPMLLASFRIARTTQPASIDHTQRLLTLL
jgi:hypothetical protein